MAEDMVERVARALAEGGHMGVSIAFRTPHPSDGGSVQRLIESDTAKAIAAARAAIEAMREPPDELLAAADIDNDDSGAPFCSNWYFFRAQLGKLVDAALSPTPPE